MKDLYLGIDGGASKTAGVILDVGGRTLATSQVGGTAMHGAPEAGVLSLLAGLVDSLCRQAGCRNEQISHCGAGLNGVDFADEHSIQLADISCAINLPSERVTLVNDAIVALWGASSSPAAVMVQHGSGFTAAYRSEHGSEMLFDHLNVGNVFDMRMELTSLVARMIDGRAEVTELKDATLSIFGIAAEKDFCEAVFRKRIPWPVLPSTLPMIYSAWQAGDPAATTLVHRATEDYALAAKAMVDRTGCDSATAVFGGGVIAQMPPEFWSLLAERVAVLCPRAKTQPPDLPPEYGAAIMAAYDDGCDGQTYFKSVLERI